MEIDNLVFFTHIRSKGISYNTLGHILIYIAYFIIIRERTVSKIIFYRFQFSLYGLGKENKQKSTRFSNKIKQIYMTNIIKLRHTDVINAYSTFLVCI